MTPRWPIFLTVLVALQACHTHVRTARNQRPVKKSPLSQALLAIARLGPEAPCALVDSATLLMLERGDSPRALYTLSRKPCRGVRTTAPLAKALYLDTEGEPSLAVRAYLTYLESRSPGEQALKLIAAARIAALPIPSKAEARRIIGAATRDPALPLFARAITAYRHLGKLPPPSFWRQMGTPTTFSMAVTAPVIGRHTFFALKPPVPFPLQHRGSASLMATPLPRGAFLKGRLSCTQSVPMAHIMLDAKGPGILYHNGRPLLMQDRHHHSELGSLSHKGSLSQGRHDFTLLVLQGGAPITPWLRVAAGGACRWITAPAKSASKGSLTLAPQGGKRPLSRLALALTALAQNQFYHARKAFHAFGDARPLIHCFELSAIAGDPSLTPLARRTLTSRIITAQPPMACKKISLARHQLASNRPLKVLSTIHGNSSLDATLLRIAALRRAKKIAKAAQAVLSALERWPSTHSVRIAAARMAGERERVSEQYTHLYNAWRLRADTIALPKMLNGIGRHRSALALISNMRRFMPQNGELAWQQLIAYRGAGDSAREGRLLTRLTTAGILPTQTAPAVDLLLSMGKRDEARALLSRRLRENPGDYDALRLLAHLGGAVLPPVPPVATYLKKRGTGFASGEFPAVFLLNDTRIHLFKNGMGYKRVHRIVRLLTLSGVDQLGEITLPDGAFPVTLRTVKPDGRFVYPERNLDKGSVTMRDLAPGDLVELMYLLPLSGIAPLNAWYGQRHDFAHPHLPALESRYSVSYPDTMAPRYVTTGKLERPKTRHHNGRKSITWSLWYLSPESMERRVYEPSRYKKSVRFGVGLTDATISQVLTEIPPWPGPRSHEMTLLVGSLCRETSRSVCVEKLATWVRQNIHHTGIVTPAFRIFHALSGNRALLFHALLHHAGIPSDLLYTMARRKGLPNPRFPDPLSLQLILVRVGAKIYDLRFPYLSAGEMVPALSGARAFIPGKSSFVTLPSQKAEQRTIRAAITLDPVGDAVITVSDTTTGYMAARRMELVSTRSRRRVEALFTRNLMHKFFPGARLLSLTWGNLKRPFTLHYRFSAPMVAVKSGDKERSLRTLPFPFRLAKKFRIYTKRRQDFLPPYTPITKVTVRVVPPKGWQVNPEPRLSLTSPFGHITRTVACNADGSALVTFVKRIAFSPVPVASWAAFREFIKTFSDYESLGLTLSRP